MNSLSRTQKPRAGFTLLEVMVVIVILGVLASLVVPMICHEFTAPFILSSFSLRILFLPAAIECILHYTPELY